jgi:hypothetical protein
MSARSRDSLTLYAIAAFAVLVTLYGDLDMGALFQVILANG